MDWGSVGPGEEWVNSATLEGEQGKTRLCRTGKRKRKFTLDGRKVGSAGAHRLRPGK